jgi:DNA-binding NarL/FixJ family response regulator
MPVAAGDALLAPSVTRRLIEGFLRRPTTPNTEPPACRSSPRASSRLELIARGHSNTEIATQLVISDATVKTHVARVYSKLDLRDRAQAVVYAYETGLVEPGAARDPG